MQSSLQALGEVAGLPVYGPVKRLLCREFDFLAQAPEPWRARFHYTDVCFRELAQVATLQRFPAGQMHWERIRCLPRKWLFQARTLQLWKTVVFGLGGLGPLVETHTNIRREGGPHFRPEDRLLTYYRVARSLEYQPEVKGLISGSWYYCAETARVSPHLAWARQIFLDNGGAQVDLGPAGEKAGFLETSATRRRLWAEGKYKPRIGLVLWPRRRMLEWAARHGELAED